jgi:hypothetical protein
MGTGQTLSLFMILAIVDCCVLNCCLLCLKLSVLLNSTDQPRF